MDSQDAYWEGLLKICSLYRSKKEIARELIEKGTSIVITILSSTYLYLVQRNEIDPIDDEDRTTRAKYLLEIL